MPEGLQTIFERIDKVTDDSVLKSPLMLQAPPLEDFKITYAHTHSEYETLLSGQFSRRGSKQLVTVEWQTLVCDQSGSVASPQQQPEPALDPTGLLRPGELLHPFSGSVLSPVWIVADGQVELMRDELIRLQDTGTPFKFTAIHTQSVNPELSMDATMRSFSVTEKMGEGDTRYFDLSLREWRNVLVDSASDDGRDATFATIHADGTATDKTGRRIPAKSSKKPKVTLADLSRFFFHGEAYHKREIAVANAQLPGIPTGARPLLGWPGTIIAIEPWKSGHGGKILIPVEAPRTRSKPKKRHHKSSHHRKH